MLDSIKQKLKQINPIDNTIYKKAGVLILLLHENDKEDMRILFTKRSSNLSTHSGEVSFPGGKWEEQDESLFDTAVRESYEEIGLKQNNMIKLGSLNFLLSRHKIEVNPFVGYLETKQVFEGNYEIDMIFTVPISFLTNPENISYKEFNRKDLKVSIPSWVYNGNHIWGLTAMITADFLNICFNASINTDLDLIRAYDDY
tara:strand:- start:2421 stop:3020 length:600 start_codon:yes stop_codon:yes gene_type:complete